MTIQELQKALIKYHQHKTKLDEKRKIFNEAEKLLKAQSDKLSKELINLKLPKLEIKDVGVFTPTIKTNYFYPASGKPEDRQAFIKWVDSKMGKGHSEKLLAMTYQQVTKLTDGAIENKWIEKDKMPPGISYKKTSYKLGVRKK